MPPRTHNEHTFEVTLCYFTSKLIPLPVLWWGTLAAFRISPTNPVASPLRGELNKLPPVLIHASTTEMLLDNATRYAAKAKAREEVDRAKEKAEEKVQEKLKEKLGEDAGEKVKDALKGLFN